MWKKVLLTVVVLAAILFYQVNQREEELREGKDQVSEKYETSRIKDGVLDSLATDDVNVENPHVIYHYKASDLMPKSNKGVIVNHHSYSLSYVEDYEQSEWVAHKLTPVYISGKAKRRSGFKYDIDISTKSATHKDYTHSGYDRGHLLPAADRKSSQEEMNETFYMSNVAPQNQCLNRKGWRLLEESIREQVEERDSLFIITGTIITNDSLRIGKNEVVVPQYFYKVILDYDPSGFCASAYLVPNTCVKKIDETYLVSIDNLEQKSGIDFFSQLPVGVQDSFESEKGCLKL